MGVYESIIKGLTQAIDGETRYKVATQTEEKVNLMLQIKWATVNKRDIKTIDKIIKLIKESEGEEWTK